MHFWGRLGKFLGLPSQTKRDSDGTVAGSSYFSNEAPDDKEGDTISHEVIGSPKHVYLVILGLFAVFLQSFESGRCKGLSA